MAQFSKIASKRKLFRTKFILSQESFYFFFIGEGGQLYHMSPPRLSGIYRPIFRDPHSWPHFGGETI